MPKDFFCNNMPQIITQIKNVAFQESALRSRKENTLINLDIFEHMSFCHLVLSFSSTIITISDISYDIGGKQLITGLSSYE